MNHNRNNRYIWLVIIAIMVFLGIPILIEILSTTIFENFPGGSNDGWLGFWGGFVGAGISVFGVYFSMLFTRKSDLEREKRDYRPTINSLSQNGIHVNDTVFHSTTSIGVESFHSRLFTLENLTNNPLLNALFIVKNDAGVLDIISISSLANKKALISYRHAEKDEVQKVEIVFQTVGKEYGLFSKELGDGTKILNPVTSFGDNAKARYNEYVKLFEKNNKDLKTTDSSFYHQNISVFNEDDYEFYKNASEKYWKRVVEMHETK